jgi:hypothetical protein
MGEIRIIGYYLKFMIRQVRDAQRSNEIGRLNQVLYLNLEIRSVERGGNLKFIHIINQKGLFHKLKMENDR